jgi:hypothetical protein
MSLSLSRLSFTSLSSLAAPPLPMFQSGTLLQNGFQLGAPNAGASGSKVSCRKENVREDVLREDDVCAAKCYAWV